MRRFAIALALALVAQACAPNDAERVGAARAALDAPLTEAYCDADVDGIGVIPTETDYLPHVIACENGGAELEALKAQAVAARSVLYWTLGTNGSICNSQGCQVYSCNNDPLPIHQQAVDETSGEYLAYNGNVTYGFYVNGDSNTLPPSCVGAPGAQNEHWITYNEGRTGTDVEQTSLGFEFDPSDAGYGQNRGCQGQWGARCLETQGYTYEAILRFYYGDDIELLKAPGPCVIPGEGGGGAGGFGGALGSGGTDAAVSSAESASSASAGGADATPTPPEEGPDEGCSCHAAGARTSGGTWLVLLIALALGRRRRRTAARELC